MKSAKVIHIFKIIDVDNPENTVENGKIRWINCG